MKLMAYVDLMHTLMLKKVTLTVVTLGTMKVQQWKSMKLMMGVRQVAASIL
jgi:hypothetical protein